MTVRDGRRKHPLYRTWRAMIARCRHAPRYLKRKTKVCSRWKNNFWDFVADMPPKPSPAHSLDRYPDNNGDYEPSNTRWATNDEQQQNTSKTRLITINGETKPLCQWARTIGVSSNVVSSRLTAGWSEQEALMMPISKHKKHKPRGLSPFPKNGRLICKKKGLSAETVGSRLRRGWSFKDAISTPIKPQKGPGHVRTK
jgi:hypothetical protein